MADVIHSLYLIYHVITEMSTKVCWYVVAVRSDKQCGIVVFATIHIQTLTTKLTFLQFKVDCDCSIPVHRLSVANKINSRGQ